MKILEKGQPELVAEEVGNDPIGEEGLTLIHPFYNDDHRFEMQWGVWHSYPEHVKDRLKIILVDDCSKVPVKDVLGDRDCNLNLRIYRIKDDLKWNTPGALNLGLHHVDTKWRLFLDSDCWFDSRNIQKIFEKDLRAERWYQFERQRIGGDRPQHTRFLPCCILIHDTLMNKIGGFDEDFTGERSGGYGFFDTFFTEELGRYARRCVIHGVICMEYHEDAGDDERTLRWGGIVTEKDSKVNRRLFYRKDPTTSHSKEFGHVPKNTKRLNFNWELAYENVRSS